MRKILIVEDDLDLVETYTDLLEAKQFQVMSVLRAADAIRRITRDKPDIIILDLNLPGDCGVVVITFVRNYPAIAKTKIIVATGHPDIMQRAGFVSRQVDAILTKPVSNNALLEMIDNFLLPAAS